MLWFEKRFVPSDEFAEGPLLHTSLRKITFWALGIFGVSITLAALFTSNIEWVHIITMIIIAPILARLTAFDLKYQLLLNVYVLPLIPLGVFYSLFSTNHTLISSLTGSITAGGSLLTLNSLLGIVNKKNNIGGGDIKFCFAAGAFTGIELLPYYFWVSFFLVLILYPLLQAKNKYISFGPALIFSLWLILFIENLLY